MKFGSSKSSFSSSSDTATDLRSFLGEGTDINGEVKFTEIMRIDAGVSGTIISETGSLLVMEKGRVKATVTAGTVEISGIVEGTITAKTSVKIHSTGRVYGDIYTPALIIEHGAVFDGKCHMLNGKDQPNKGLGKVETKLPITDTKGLKTADVI